MENRYSTIALITDFGTRDWFSGVIKGVILSIAPGVNIVDITHEIPPGDIRSAAFVLKQCIHYFPPDTIFIAVADPGVGGRRRGIAVLSGGRIFAGPDNGIFSHVYETGAEFAVRSIDNPDVCLPDISGTFHGRDIFAPAAARLAAGKTFGSLGKAVNDPVRIGLKKSIISLNEITGEVLYVDRFGNLITSITSEELRLLGNKKLSVKIKDEIVPLYGFYSETRQGKPLAVLGSCGLLEICVNLGNASKVFGMNNGSEVRVLAE